MPVEWFNIVAGWVFLIAGITLRALDLIQIGRICFLVAIVFFVLHLIATIEDFIEAYQDR